MTVQEAKLAMLSEIPVTGQKPDLIGQGDTNYKKINALIFRKLENGEVKCSLELQDFHTNSISIYPVESVKITNAY